VPEAIPLATGIFGTAFNEQAIDTTVSVSDGQTIILGGLITRRDSKVENKIPILGDLPIAGALFRFRTRTQERTELLVILTPHIVRSRADMERVMAEEERRLHWMLDHVQEIHGISGEPLFPSRMGPALHPPVEQAPPPRPMPRADARGKQTPASSAAAASQAAHTMTPTADVVPAAAAPLPTPMPTTHPLPAVRAPQQPLPPR
jgi:type II/III secretion system protein